MLENVENLVGEKISLLGIETRLSDAERGLKMQIRDIRSEDGEYVAIYEHDSHKKQAIVRLKLYKGAEKVSDEERDTGGGEFPEHDDARNSTFKPEDGDHIHNSIFIVKSVEVHDIKRTNPEKHV